LLLQKIAVTYLELANNTVAWWPTVRADRDSSNSLKPENHNLIVAIGFAFFACIFAFTFLLLMLVSLGVFVSLGISFASESGDNTNASIGIVGGVLAVVFYFVLGLFFVLPISLASWKLFKRRPYARLWATIASILVLAVMPFGTALGIYCLWFLFSAQGKQFQSSSY